MTRKVLPQKHRNLVASIALMAACVYWFVTASAYRPLSRLYPQVVAAIVFGLALVLLILTLVGHGPVISMAKGPVGERHVRAGTLIITMVGWTALIPIVGFLVASVVGVTVLGLITFRAHAGTVRAVFIAVAAVVVFYFIFQVALYVPFPAGLLFG